MIKFISNMRIKQRIIFITLTSLLLVSLSMGVVSYYLTSSAIENTLSYSLVGLSQEGSKQIT
ncbi:MAG: hypothetical protein RBS92_06910 [Candidatus Cloacimonadales bacterium]|jgi:hypothetical protein|nr:hypothetical protein [Candidatus Cloacimonadales bacterium]